MGLETRRIEITAFNGERTRESVFRRSVQCGRPHEQFIPCAIYMTGGARFYLPATWNACIFLRFYFFFFSFFIEEKKRSAPGACRREYDTRPPCVSRYNSLAALRRSIINFHDRLTSTVRMTNDEYCISPSSFDGLALWNQREKKKKKKRKTATCVQVGKWFLEDVVLRSNLVTLSHGIR